MKKNRQYLQPQISNKILELRFHNIKDWTLLIILLISNLFLYAQERLPNVPSDYLPSKFHADRRDLLRAKMPANSVAVFFANPVRNRSNDVNYVYHQDPNFYYFTGYKEPNAILLIFKDKQSDASRGAYNEIIFVQPKDKFSELWDGRRLGKDGAKEKLKITQASNNIDFAGYNLDFSKFDKVLFYDFFDDVRDNKRDSGDLYNLIAHFKDKIGFPAKGDPSLNPEPKPNNIDMATLDIIINDMRGIKTPEELKLLRKAIDISCIGQVEIMKAMHPGMSEPEIQGVHEFVFKKYGSEYEGYPSIVGAGNNGCILHYIDNAKPLIDSKEMVLMDLGAEYRGYTADVTRTIPVNGKFSKEQKAIYDLVYKSQEAVFALLKPKTSWREMNEIAREVINEGLQKLGIINKSSDKHMYFPHGLGHHIGLDVHDKGTYTLLEENMVITVEPGIYIPDGSKCDKKWWGIAVRIEDDVLITKDGYELLSDKAPRTTEAIEAMMAQPSPLDHFHLPTLDE